MGACVCVCARVCVCVCMCVCMCVSHYRACIERVVLPALDAFQPQIIFVSCGYDAGEMHNSVILVTQSASLLARIRQYQTKYAKGCSTTLSAVCVCMCVCLTLHSLHGTLSRHVSQQ